MLHNKMPNQNKLKPLETNTTTSMEEAKTEVFFCCCDQNPKHESCRCTEHQKQQLTSEFLGWVVEVARVWLNHTAIIHKSGGTTVIISQSDTIHQNKFKSRPEFTFITVIFHPRIRNAATNTLKHAFFTLTWTVIHVQPDKQTSELTCLSVNILTPPACFKETKLH